MAQREIPLARWLDGLPVTPEYLQTKGNWLSWDLYVRVMRRFEELIGPGADEASALAYVSASSALDFLRSIIGLFADLGWLYWFGFTAVGSTVFPVVAHEFERLEERRIRLTLTLPSALEDYPFFFQVTHHVLRLFPAVVGSGPSEVQLVLAPRRAVYVVDLPPSKTLLPRAVKSLRSLGTLESLGQLIQQGVELARSVSDVDAVNRKLQGLTAVLSGRVGEEPNRAQDHVALASYHDEMATLSMGAHAAGDQDYRRELLSHFQRIRARNPRYSMRSFARRLGLSPTMLSNVFSGKRELSVEAAMTIAERLEYSPADARRFCRLVQLQKLPAK